MFEIFANPNFKIIVTFLVTILAFISFIKEKVPAHVTAMVVMIALLIFGIIDTNDALNVFSNPAGITIACMFIISSALQKTGVIDLIGSNVLLLTQKNKIIGITALFLGILITSAFMNNTPVVIIMTPIVIELAKKLQHNPSKYLIPLSYVAILGGTCTLIGTSTNILVDAIAQDHGQEPFSMFEITLPGIIVATSGMLFLTFIGRKLLPDRPLLEKEFANKHNEKEFIAEALVASESKFIGKTIDEVELIGDIKFQIIDVIRQDTKISTIGIIKEMISKIVNQSFRNSHNLGKEYLKEGDKIIFRVTESELINLKKLTGLNFNKDNIEEPEAEIYEGVIGMNSKFIERKASDLKLRAKYGCYILAIHRDKKNIISNFDEIILKYGDVLLIEGPKEKMDELFDNESIMNVTKAKRQEFNNKKAPIAIATLFGVVGLAAFNIMPIAGLAMIGAVIVIVTRCVEARKIHKSIQWPILILIFGMLSLSIALYKTGGANLIVDFIANLVGHHGPVVLLITIYVITSFFTEIMSNNAAAVLLTPIAIGLAESIGVDSRPFIIAIMFAASASFATPIGYQTNTYIYNIGNYRFSDFLKIGIPMNLTIMFVAINSILLIWDF